MADAAPGETVKHWNCVATVLLLFIALSCKSAPDDEVTGKWVSPDGKTLEFFEDGTFLQRDEKSGDLSGEYLFLPDGRLKLDMTVLGTRAVKVYEQVEIGKDRLRFRDEGGELTALYQAEGTVMPEEFVGLWKVSTGTSKNRQPESALYWRLGDKGDLLGPGPGIWFVKNDTLSVAYANGLLWQGTREGDTIYGKVFYDNGRSDSFECQRLSTDPDHPAISFVACFSGSSTLSCVNSESRHCSSWTGPTFAKLNDCVRHCRQEASARGGHCTQ